MLFSSETLDFVFGKVCRKFVPTQHFPFYAPCSWSLLCFHQSILTWLILQIANNEDNLSVWPETGCHSSARFPSPARVVVVVLAGGCLIKLAFTSDTIWITITRFILVSTHTVRVCTSKSFQMLISCLFSLSQRSSFVSTNTNDWSKYWIIRLVNWKVIICYDLQISWSANKKARMQ